jgi:hypothetical protein
MAPVRVLCKQGGRSAEIDRRTLFVQRQQPFQSESIDCFSATAPMAATAAAVVAPAGLEQINRQQCTYTACYCEENVYHLLQHLVESGSKQADCLFAVFISNSNETVSGPLQQCCIDRDDSNP